MMLLCERCNEMNLLPVAVPRFQAAPGLPANRGCLRKAICATCHVLICCTRRCAPAAAEAPAAVAAADPSPAPAPAAAAPPPAVATAWRSWRPTAPVLLPVASAGETFAAAQM